MTSTKIKQHLQEHPSYLKWSVERLCAKFECTRKIMYTVIDSLHEFKKTYIRQCSDNFALNGRTRKLPKRRKNRAE